MEDNAVPMHPQVSLPLASLVLLCAACHPVSVVIDCPPSVEADTEFDVVATLEKSGGETEFDVDYSWSSPSPYNADMTYLAIDGEALDPPETSGYLTVADVPEGNTTITAAGSYCPNADGACWGTLTVAATALKGGLFGEDRESDACVIDLTQPGGG